MRLDIIGVDDPSCLVSLEPARTKECKSGHTLYIKISFKILN